MKKVFLSLAVLFSVALVSCGGNKANEENQEAEAPVEEVVDVAVATDTVQQGDSTVVDTIAAAAVEEAAPAEAAK